MKISQIKYLFSLVLLVCIALVSCNPAKRLAQGDLLLMKNRYVFVNKAKNNVNTEELSLYLKQRPNKKILYFFKFHLGMYDFAGRLNKQDKKKGIIYGPLYWFKHTIGEEPVVYSADLSNKSAKLMQKYLFNKGYFNASVKDSLVMKGSKKAITKYLINLNAPYRLNSLKYAITDSAILKIVFNDTVNCLLEKGSFYNADIFEKERIRLERLLLDAGYYGFSKDYIRYKVDSNMNSHLLNIELIVLNKGKTPEKKDILHRKYSINNVYIYPSYIPLISDTVKFDTIASDNCYFLVKSKVEYKKHFLAQNTKVRKGEMFQQLKAEQTFQSFTYLKTFTYINIYYKETDEVDSAGNNMLNCFVQLTPTKMQSYSIEAEGTNYSPLLGLGGNITYQHKNIFKGAELFNVKVRGALEFQNTNTSSEKASGKYMLFNTHEYGVESNLLTPRLLLPFKLFNIEKMFAPQTIYSAGYNYQSRKDYNRSILNITYGGNIRVGKSITHLFNPIEYNYVRIEKDSVFNSKVIATSNPTIINSFQSHLVAGLRYSFTFNNQQERNGLNYWFFKANFEMAGNMLRVVSPYLHFSQFLDDSYQVLGIRYAQYIRPSVDLRHFIVFNKQNVLAGRLMGGVGYPYLNNKALPFEKSFFAGGANSIRAWKIYELGPGSYNDTLINTKTGDLQMEANLEYRFPIFGRMKGALFVDAGNIWMTHKDLTRPGAEFDRKRFLSEIAVGTGVGFRFDFTYFIIRIDAAAKVRNPLMPVDQRWVVRDIHPKTINYNLGIGYPF